MPEKVSDFSDPVEIFLATIDELNRMPEYYYSNDDEETSFACPHDGSFTFRPGDEGVSYTYEKCAFTKDFEMTGSGGYNYETEVVYFSATITGSKTGQLDFSYNWNNGRSTLKGEYGGKRYDQ